jgi:putative addiction module killer protein
MMLIVKTHIWFDEWIAGIRNPQDRARVSARLQMLTGGHLGDVAPIGSGVSELRMHFGPGYRIYFTKIGQTIYFLIGGGDKSTQARDIRKAITIAQKLKDRRS